MAVQNHIENPFEYVLEKLSWSAGDAGRRLFGRHPEHRLATAPAVRRITPADLGDALREGLADLGASRADVLFIGAVYPIAGLVLAALAFNANLAPLVFPLVSGFAMLGPLAAVGLYEISRRRERGEPASLAVADKVLHSPSLGSILALGAILLGLFLAWLAVAYLIWLATLGPVPPLTASQFVREALTTSAGWTMIVVGCGVGALFAIAAFALSVVSFPLLLDRDVGVSAAVSTSLAAIRANPGVMALWGLIVAASLAIGSVPVLAGLVLVMPLLGHATWHLYRKLTVD